MLKNPEEPRDDFTVALVSSDILSDEEFRRTLGQYRQKLEQKIEFIRNEIPQRSREKQRVAMAIERWLRLTEAELNWLDELQ
jgi:hypothetical protein